MLTNFVVALFLVIFNTLLEINAIKCYSKVSQLRGRRRTESWVQVSNSSKGIAENCHRCSVLRNIRWVHYPNLSRINSDKIYDYDFIMQMTEVYECLPEGERNLATVAHSVWKLIEKYDFYTYTECCQELFVYFVYFSSISVFYFKYNKGVTMKW